MSTLAAGRKRLLQQNGYTLDLKSRLWIGPNGKTITEAAARHQLEIWLENTIRQQQGQVIR